MKVNKCTSTMPACTIDGKMDSEPMDEVDIIRAVKAGDSRFYRLLVERYHRPVLTYIYKMIGEKYLTEDIGQEVFFIGYRKMKSFDEKKGVSFSAWIFTIARNQCIAVLRRKSGCHLDIEQVANIVDGRKGPEEILLARERLSVVAASLQHVPEPFRKTIQQSLAGYSLERNARSQNITLGTVKSRLFRAKERMRVLVGACLGCKDDFTSLHFSSCPGISRRKI